MTTLTSHDVASLVLRQGSTSGHHPCTVVRCLRDRPARQRQRMIGTGMSSVGARVGGTNRNEPIDNELEALT